MSNKITAPLTPVRVAVIGAGNMGRFHVRNYANLPEAILVGVADLSSSAKDLAHEYHATYFNDFLELLDIAQPEAVSIVVPTKYHARIGMECMKRGIHCLIEKPIAETIQEADDLIKLAQRQHVVFTVGHLERFNPIIRKLKDLLDVKTVGEVTSVVCKRVGGFPAVEPKTDVIVDLAVHDIDIINYLLGRQPKKLHAHGSRSHHSNKIDAAEILIDYGDASGFIQANWITPVKIRTIAVTGSQGYIEGNYITQELVLYEHNMKRVNTSFESFVGGLGKPKRQSVNVNVEEPLAVELRTFLEHVRGKSILPLVDPSDARQALHFALSALKPTRTES